MDDVQCTGTESSLISCTHITNHNCNHGEDAGVKCTTACKYTKYSINFFVKHRYKVLNA